MTESMNELYDNLCWTIDNLFEEEYSETITCGKIKTEDIAIQALMDSAVNALHSKTEKHSMRYYYKEHEYDESECKQIERILQYINKKRNERYYIVKEGSGIEIKGLESKKIGNKDRRKGHEYTPFQFWEITDMYNTELFKSILEGRFYNKNMTTDRIIGMIRDCDKMIEELKKNRDNLPTPRPQDYIGIFNIEKSYSLNFYCDIADMAVRLGIKDIEQYMPKIKVFVAPGIRIPGSKRYANQYGNYYSEVSYINLRRRLVADIFSDSYESTAEISLFNEVISLNMMLRKGYVLHKYNLDDYVLNNATIEDIYSIFLEYDPYRAWIKSKTLNPGTVRILKQIYGLENVSEHSQDKS